MIASIKEWVALTPDEKDALPEEDKKEVARLLYDRAMRVICKENINHSTGEITWKEIDPHTAAIAFSLLEEGWVLNPPFGFANHHGTEKVQEFDEAKGLVKVGDSWHNIFDLLSIGFSVVPL